MLFRKGKGGFPYPPQVRHLTLHALPTTNELLSCLEANRPEKRDLPFGSLVVQSQDDLIEVPKWFSIASTVGTGGTPCPSGSNGDWQNSGLVVPLKALAKVMRGIATGANEFFVLPTQQVKQYSLKPYVVRIILNRAGVRPLNMFSLIYPNRYVTDADATEMLWALLNSHFSLSRLHSVSRTYGGNTLKVEPRELDNLPVINPLALSADARQKVRGWIADFYCHQQASVLIRQIDELVEALLGTAASSTNRSSLPIQLRLLETGEDYEPFCT